MPPFKTPRTSPSSHAASHGLYYLLWLSAAATVLTPLLIHPGAWDDSYFQPKWVWLLGWGTVGLAAMLGRALLGRAAILPLKFLSPVVLAFASLQFISLFWARSGSLALERALQVAALTLAFLTVVQVLRSHRGILAYGWMWIVVADITAVWTLGQDFTRAFAPERTHVVSNLSDWRGYLAAGLGNTSHIGDLTALALLASLVYLGEARRRAAMWIALGSAVILAAALTVSYSVGSNLGLFAGGALMLGISLRREGLRFFRRRKRWIGLAIAWATMLAFFLLDHPLNPHRPGLLSEGFGSDRWREGGPTRLVIWANGLEIVRQHSILGVGAGNFTYVFPSMQSPLIADHPDMLVYQGRWTNAAHNELLQSWAELGILGLILFILMPVTALFYLLQEIRWCPRSEYLPRLALAGLVTAWTVQSMMNFSLQQPTGALCFYAMLAVTLAEFHVRRGAPMMPAFVLERGRLRIRVDWREMRRPLSMGITFRISPWSGLIGMWFLLAAAYAVWPFLKRPLESQNEYRKAREDAIENKDPDDQERHLRRALKAYPWATGCRSYYVEWLIRHKRAKDALDQLEKVRERLDSPELYEREARALMMLGKRDEAEEQFRIYTERLWIARHSPTQPAQK